MAATEMHSNPFNMGLPSFWLYAQAHISENFSSLCLLSGGFMSESDVSHSMVLNWYLSAKPVLLY
ncbi:hypothetical protein VEA_001208 [Vibrio antiquarius]|uniref:Uncharacterized protein n=1 Tax=Vibrio antiquarius (strain Ex25) TaxID=150340 RepID=A0ACA6QTV2_VIBAE|nr:hypothetical protein VEA_001208 [Vibrio antiquarius]